MQSIKPDIIYLQQSGWGYKGRLFQIRVVRPDRAGHLRADRAVGAARSASARRMGLFLHGLERSLLLRDRDAAGGLLQEAHRQGPVHRRLTNRTRDLHDRHRDARLCSSTAAIGKRTGNRSPDRPAAPHGAYRCAGRTDGSRSRSPMKTNGARWPRRWAIRPGPRCRFRSHGGAGRKSGRTGSPGRCVDREQEAIRATGPPAAGRGAGRSVPDRRGPGRA